MEFVKISTLENPSVPVLYTVTGQFYEAIELTSDESKSPIEEAREFVYEANPDFYILMCEANIQIINNDDYSDVDFKQDETYAEYPKSTEQFLVIAKSRNGEFMYSKAWDLYRNDDGTFKKLAHKHDWHATSDIAP